jgi:phage I-like protein
MLGASQEVAKSTPRQTQSIRGTRGTPSLKITDITNLSVIGIINNGFIKATKENVSIRSYF